MGQKLKQAISVTNISMTKQLCCVMDAYLSIDIIDPVDIEYLYIFSVLWSLGAALTGTARIKLNGMLCFVISFYVMLCHDMSYCVMICYIILCFIMLCYVMLYYVILCYSFFLTFLLYP